MSGEAKPASATTRRRDEFWAQGVRGLFLINGGGAVALLTFLQAIWGTEPAMVPWVVRGLVCLAIGVVFAAAVPILRAKTAEHWLSASGKGKRYKRFYEALSLLSVAMFFLGIIVLAWGAYSVVGQPVGAGG